VSATSNQSLFIPWPHPHDVALSLCWWNIFSYQIPLCNAPQTISSLSWKLKSFNANLVTECTQVHHRNKNFPILFKSWTFSSVSSVKKSAHRTPQNGFHHQPKATHTASLYFGMNRLRKLLRHNFTSILSLTIHLNQDDALTSVTIFWI
jgi:hypothetical protein